MENNDLERAIQIWFDMKYELYSRLDRDDSIYLYYEGEVYADIRIYKGSKTIFHKVSIWNDFFEIFPIEINYFNQIMVNRVEDTFGLKGFKPIAVPDVAIGALKIPK